MGKWRWFYSFNCMDYRQQPELAISLAICTSWVQIRCCTCPSSQLLMNFFSSRSDGGCSHRWDFVDPKYSLSMGPSKGSGMPLPLTCSGDAFRPLWRGVAALHIREVLPTRGPQSGFCHRIKDVELMSFSFIGIAPGSFRCAHSLTPFPALKVSGQSPSFGRTLMPIAPDLTLYCRRGKKVWGVILLWWLRQTRRKQVCPLAEASPSYLSVRHSITWL